jgi:hypothetical protein
MSASPARSGRGSASGGKTAAAPYSLQIRSDVSKSGDRMAQFQGSLTASQVVRSVHPT